jgi:CubicO group peptidase (beta-lactamase class C family)
MSESPRSLFFAIRIAEGVLPVATRLRRRGLDLGAARAAALLVAAVVSTPLPLGATDPACRALDLPAGEIVRGDVGEALDRFVRGMTGQGYSGAILVSRGGEILLLEGYGLADRERSVPNTSETLFDIASVSKTFTAAAVLDLEEDGLLRTDDLVSRTLGAFPEPKSAATIHHLLTHTAGMAVRGTPLEYDTRQAFIESMRNAPLESAPGEAFRYTTAGYTLLAAIVEEVTGQPFETVLRERLFEPACMDSTRYVWEVDASRSPLAIGYAGETVDELEPTPAEEDVWGKRGPGGFATTVGDLYRWILALGSDAILSDASKKKMFTAWVGDEGYGWHVIETDHGTLYRRGGGQPGFESSLRWYVDEDVVMAFTINNHLRLRVPLAEGVESIVLGEPAEVPE